MSKLPLTHWEKRICKEIRQSDRVKTVAEKRMTSKEFEAFFSKENKALRKKEKADAAKISAARNS